MDFTHPLWRLILWMAGYKLADAQPRVIDPTKPLTYEDIWARR
jgi:hypothetical protein